jgi:hypothetical protein
MSDSKSSDILSDGPVKDILRPVKTCFKTITFLPKSAVCGRCGKCYFIKTKSRIFQRMSGFGPLVEEMLFY